MPKADFYAGLPLAEQLQKLVDHHHDPAVRHISRDEASILEAAVSRLKAGVALADRRSEFEDVWERLEHRYETVILSASSEYQLVATSIPARSNEVPASARDLVPADWVSVEGPATPRAAQIALNSLFRRLIDPGVDVAALWSQSTQRRSAPADDVLGDAENELLNRALYQPTIAIESSPPVFAPLSSILAEASGAGWLAIVEEAANDPLAILATGGVVIVLAVSRRVLSQAAEGLGSGLKERLYEWARPKESPPEDAGD